MYWLNLNLMLSGEHATNVHCSTACIWSHSFHQVNFNYFFILSMFVNTGIYSCYYLWGLKLKSKYILLHQEAEKIVAMLSELAKVIAQEKQLLEEFYDLFQTIGVFEVTNFNFTWQPRENKVKLASIYSFIWVYRK